MTNNKMPVIGSVYKSYYGRDAEVISIDDTGRVEYKYCISGVRERIRLSSFFDFFEEIPESKEVKFCESETENEYCQETCELRHIYHGRTKKELGKKALLRILERDLQKQEVRDKIGDKIGDEKGLDCCETNKINHLNDSVEMEEPILKITCKDCGKEFRTISFSNNPVNAHVSAKCDCEDCELENAAEAWNTSEMKVSTQSADANKKEWSLEVKEAMEELRKQIPSFRAALMITDINGEDACSKFTKSAQNLLNTLDEANGKKQEEAEKKSEEKDAFTKESIPFKDIYKEPKEKPSSMLAWEDQIGEAKHHVEFGKYTVKNGHQGISHFFAIECIINAFEDLQERVEKMEELKSS